MEWYEIQMNEISLLTQDSALYSALKKSYLSLPQ